MIKQPNSEHQSVEDVHIDNDKGIVSFKRNYFFSSFKWTVYPFQRDRFALVFITSSDFLKNTRLFQQIKHAFLDPPILSALNLHDASIKLCDFTTPLEQLKTQLAIFDLTPTAEFKSVCSDAIPAPSVDSSLSWLRLLEIQRILIPNLMMKTDDPTSQMNYSHTIWLASKFDQVPTILRSSAHMMIATSPSEINSLLESKTGIKELVSSSDLSFIVTSTLFRDMELMTIPNYQIGPSRAL